VQLHLVGALAWTGSLLLPPSQRWLVWLATFVYEAVVVGSPRLRAEHRRHPTPGPPP
jgi:low temperature requirement protein LtrA